MDKYELNYREFSSYKNKTPLSWHTDPPVWPLAEQEWVLLNDGAILHLPDGTPVVKGVNEIKFETVVLGSYAYITVGVKGHVFAGDENMIPEGVNFPSATQ